MPRVRVTELRAVAALLDAPADSVEELAADVIGAIEELRAKRTDWVVVAQHAPSVVAVYGPYVSETAARRDIGKSVVASTVGERFLVLPLHTSIEEGVA